MRSIRFHERASTIAFYWKSWKRGARNAKIGWDKKRREDRRIFRSAEREPIKRIVAPLKNSFSSLLLLLLLFLRGAKAFRGVSSRYKALYVYSTWQYTRERGMEACAISWSKRSRCLLLGGESVSIGFTHLFLRRNILTVIVWADCNLSFWDSIFYFDFFFFNFDLVWCEK